LIFTIFDEEDKVVEAIKAGAAGYMLKGAEAERIVERCGFEWGSVGRVIG
jgi:DNA-binding NarL/FixJ family response regulator